MGDKRARKQQKREQKKRDRAAYAEKRAKLLESVVGECPDCGEKYRTDKTGALHRKGRCGFNPTLAAAVDRILEERAEAYDDSSDGFLPCPSKNCSRKIKLDNERHVRSEGKLVWLGCEFCYEKDETEIDRKLEEIRADWPETKEAQAELERVLKQAAEEKAKAWADAQARFVEPLKTLGQPTNVLGEPTNVLGGLTSSCFCHHKPCVHEQPDVNALQGPPSPPDDSKRIVPFPSRESIWSRAMQESQTPPGGQS